MKKRSMAVRIVAIILAALMIVSVAAVAFTAFAAGPDIEVPVTGQRESNTKWLILLIVLAVVAIVACVVLPMAKKKK